MNDREIFSVAERMASHYVSGYCFNHADIAAFARWAAGQEREACAQIADAEASIEGIAQRIAAAIRARGNT